ncbi:ketopantoate reductase PanE/ApbA C terminal-domain-containing protein [Aspergillus caelatus]|uniref:2-dehydropantoate 2-reductase n=1 Tax=Aspergillus caelatus TaxID=61420 RepID=A0A5N7AK82_9EURO|nr:ketopantoate reductase PanE/ApbA C terminal-domain-containing protein [Aspergillus caelatus]KAE8370302.1 ketopantoate reductase PanE/ApbA C terminal-domain-containing protein [Aspergillus caelatus]
MTGFEQPYPIYILGLGSIGSFIAHTLRCLSAPPPVNLLLHRESLCQDFEYRDRKIKLQVGEGGVQEKSSGFEVERIDGDWCSTSNDQICCLIVTVKASGTLSALEPIKHRLGPHSTICLFQNGLGQVETLNEKLFPDPLTRPTYVLGIMRHGAYLRSPFEAVLSGTDGSAVVGVVDCENRNEAAPGTRFILDTLLRSAALQCAELGWTDLLKAQLLKLAANCVINPLTALLDVRNGEITENKMLIPTWHRLLEEISAVFNHLPELQHLPAEQRQFSFCSLKSALVNTVLKTASNSSSMREDVRKGRGTEIQFINGWVVRRGAELGINCPTNAFLAELILAKSN